MAPSSQLHAGLLVEIHGMDGPASIPEDWKRTGVLNARGKTADVNGQKAQLVEWSEDSGHWIVATYSGLFVTVKEAHLRPLSPEDVAGYDVVLGPRSEEHVLGEEIASRLQADGVCLIKAFVSDEDLGAMVDVADRCVREQLFVRLPRELEEGYLGREGRGKVMHMGMEGEAEAFVKESPLKQIDDAILTVGRLVDPYTDRDFGFQLAGRSDTLLTMPFDGDEDDYELCDVENEEAAKFLEMMWRAKLAVIANSGRAPATLTLFPKISEDADEVEPLTFTVEPGTLAAFLPGRHKFSYRCEEGTRALTSMCWFLEPAKRFGVVQFDDTLAATVTGTPPPDNENSIAVVSMCTRYACGADEPEKLWAAYSKAAMDSFIQHPMSRWDCEMYYEKDSDSGFSGKSYSCHGGFSDGIELFDCRFFDISPAEAGGMDPTQRQVMEVSYVSLQGGGYEKKLLGGKPQQIGMFVGLDKNEWQSIPKENSGGGFGASNSANAITSNRFSYSLNLKGASMTIDTACSASLVCTHTAKLYLLHKQYDPCVACITTGVNLLLGPHAFIGCCGAGMLSHNGRCFTFNASADGYARGESTASHCIKPRQYNKGDDLCMFAGSQVNQDGRSASLTAPNGPAQERCNLAVMREANLVAAEIDTTECHGTGTSLGDPIEVGAYKKVMKAGTRHEPVIVTTCKSNIGHCEGSAGIGGFLKCCLMSMNSEGCSNVHLSCYNPHMDINGFPGIFPSESVPLRYDTSYNGVLSFGFGGTNACAQVWGQNVWNSRCGGGKSGYQQIMDTIRNAPAQEVTIMGDDWEDWEMAGADKDGKSGDRWGVTIDDDGGVHYQRQWEREKDLGDAYQLSGTFNEWGMEEMELDEMLHGLYATTVTIGAQGVEHFQIVADGNAEMTFHPSSSSCTRRSEKVQGPDAADRDHAWCIRGNEGDKFRIELYRSESDNLSINWIKQR